MRRTEYFNYTKPTEVQLNNTEDSKIDSLLFRTRSNCQFGIQEGFTVTVNSADNTKFDIGPGTGYTGGFFPSENLRGYNNSGERISTITPSPSGTPSYTPTATAVALANYALNTKNYVCLKYEETTNIALQERYYPFLQHDTIVTETFSVEVMIEADWNALISSQKEERILVGIITANGAGVALTSNSIDQLIQPKSHPSPTQPSSITGTIITGISAGTVIGFGTLRYEPATGKMYWTAPGDIEGTGISVIGSSGVYTLYSDSVSYTLTIEVIPGNLPLVDTTESITVNALYGRKIPLACAVDQAHRDMVGTGVVSETNTHGLALKDLTGGEFEHADLYHINGISRDAQADQLQCSIDVPHDLISITNNGGFRNHFLIDGTSYETLKGLSAGIDGAVPFTDNVVTPQSGDYLLYIDNAGNPQKVLIAPYVPLNAADLVVLWDSNIQIYDIKNTTAGNGTLTCQLNVGGLELTWQAPGDAVGVGVPIGPLLNDGASTNPEGFYKIYSGNTANWIIVYIDNIGNLPVGNSTFAITKNETEHSDESILKIGIVTWNAIGELLGNLRDLRRFNTADNRTELEEQHDEFGRHTKPLNTALRINVEDGYALEGRVINNNVGVYGSALNIGVYGVGNLAYGIIGSAGNTGVYGTTPGDYGVYGKADVKIGVFGTAPNTAVCGSAVNLIGVKGYASETAMYGVASTTGVYGYASNETGVYGKASTTGVYGYASKSFGVYGWASMTAIFGTATVDVGVMGDADRDYGVAGLATRSIGVYGSASVRGVYGIATTTGVLGLAADSYGVYGSAISDTGVYGIADENYGVYGSALINYGVYGKANNLYGVYGEAPNSAVHGVAAVAVGVYGQANNTGVYGVGLLGTGVYGVAVAGNIGVCGIANVGNTGVYGEAGVNYGVYGKAVVNYGVFGTALQDYGVRGIADRSFGVAGSASAWAGWFYADANGGIYARAHANSTVLHCGGGTIRYDVPISALHALQASGLPIIITEGAATNTYLLGLYATA